MVKSRRGSTLVESAIILPLVIFSIIAIVFMMITQYEVTAQMAYFHTALRNNAGEISETFSVKPDTQITLNFSRKNSVTGVVIEDETEIKRNNFVFLGDYSRKVKAKAYCINEEDIIRAVR